MNFLQLCQRVRQEVGIPGSGPSSVVDQTGELKKVVDWVREAWIEVQLGRTDWNFMWAEVTCTWPAGYRTRSAEQLNITDLGRWGREMTFAPLNQPQKGLRVDLYRWHRFKTLFGDENPGAGQIRELSVSPSNVLHSRRISDMDYALTFNYYRQPQYLSANGDLPYMKSGYHDLIIYKAVKKYAGNEEAANMYTDATNNIRMWNGILERDELPQIADGSYSLERHGD